jgi:hypothetical protein
MQVMNWARGAAVAVMLAAAPVAGGEAATFDFSWTGAGGYTMTGSFSFADSLLNTGAITGASLTSFTMTVFLSGVSQGSWSSTDPLGTNALFNFNFNTTTLAFVLGGASNSPSGQLWNAVPSSIDNCTTVGFGTGFSGQIVCVGGSRVLDSLVNASNPITVTRADTPVPAPAALGLFGLGVAALGLLRRARATA